jgi:hypothetical protein
MKKIYQRSRAWSVTHSRDGPSAEVDIAPSCCSSRLGNCHNARMTPLIVQIVDSVKDTAFALTSCLCQPSANIKLNGRTFKIVKLLGEGGFSYVYLGE